MRRQIGCRWDALLLLHPARPKMTPYAIQASTPHAGLPSVSSQEQASSKVPSAKSSDGADGSVTGGLTVNRSIINALAGQLITDSAARSAAADLLISSDAAGRHLLLLAVARASFQGVLQFALWALSM